MSWIEYVKKHCDIYFFGTKKFDKIWKNFLALSGKRILRKKGVIIRNSECPFSIIFVIHDLDTGVEGEKEKYVCVFFDEKNNRFYYTIIGTYGMILEFCDIDDRSISFQEKLRNIFQQALLYLVINGKFAVNRYFIWDEKKLYRRSKSSAVCEYVYGVYVYVPKTRIVPKYKFWARLYQPGELTYYVAFSNNKFYYCLRTTIHAVSFYPYPKSSDIELHLDLIRKKIVEQIRDMSQG